MNSSSVPRATESVSVFQKIGFTTGLPCCVCWKYAVYKAGIIR